jgi:thioredoxin reductase
MEHDVIIIGGSYAGLSAAMALGRSLRKVLLIDSGLPCNRQTPHSHNFITQDGERPGAIADKARAQVLRYDTVQFVNDVAVSAWKTEKGFEVTTQGGRKSSARKLIFATGIQDSLPPIKGFAACWGISVVHCPYCHGYELRGVRTGIMANGERAFHLASLVSNLTKDVTVLTSGRSELTPEQVAKLAEYNIKIVETPVSEIEHRQGRVETVVFNDGTKTIFDAVYAALPFTQHSDIPGSLGCELTDLGYLKVDASQKTTVDGVFACGDNSSMMRSVANAVYTGNITGAMVNRELTLESF